MNATADEEDTANDFAGYGATLPVRPISVVTDSVLNHRYGADSLYLDRFSRLN